MIADDRIIKNHEILTAPISDYHVDVIKPVYYYHDVAKEQYALVQQTLKIRMIADYIFNILRVIQNGLHLPFGVSPVRFRKKVFSVKFQRISHQNQSIIFIYSCTKLLITL